MNCLDEHSSGNEKHGFYEYKNNDVTSFVDHCNNQVSNDHISGINTCSSDNDVSFWTKIAKSSRVPIWSSTNNTRVIPEENVLYRYFEMAKRQDVAVRKNLIRLTDQDPCPNTQNTDNKVDEDKNYGSAKKEKQSYHQLTDDTNHHLLELHSADDMDNVLDQDMNDMPQKISINPDNTAH